MVPALICGMTLSDWSTVKSICPATMSCSTGTGAAIGNEVGRQAELGVEDEASDVGDRADAGVAVADRRALVLHVGDEVLEVRGRQRLLGDDRLRRVVDDADLREAFRRIVFQVRIERRRRRLRPHVADRDGVAVRRGLGGAGHAEAAAGAADVLDDEGLAERAAHVLADQAGDDIGRPAGGERHDDGDRFGRILLRQRRRAQRRQRDETARSQKTNAPHRALPRRSLRAIMDAETQAGQATH